MQSPIFWFTGLSGSGKTTVTKLVSDILVQKNLKVRIIDGDDVRDNYAKRLGFSPEDIEINNKLICDLCQKERQHYDLILVPVISPLDKVRRMVKERLEPGFYLIYCNAKLESVMERDVKGLYQKAKEGKIPDMIGFSEVSPYEIPKNADLVLNTDGKVETEEETVSKVFEFIMKNLA